ncbi:MAG: hypothetical protein COB02_00075 [Candidatus Cloacimonadota bacterium]|nr:MAG: hypothetical protein COB02_04210 [Candidatus Cloacimonadota bacterium]PCJ21019.1 MAG: hypothetical protein COB02_00075 [Candidatus Cloacimonadota bacterium]
MKINRKQLDNNIVFYSFDGALDTLVEDEIKIIMNSDLDNNIPYFILDLSEVEFIMSTIIGFLISFQNKLKENKGKLIILNPSDEVKIVFKVLGLNLMFEFSKSLELAKSKLS